MLQDRFHHLLIDYFQKIYINMKEKFKTILSPNYNDIELVEKMYHSGYKLMTIVTPNNYPYKDTVGYVYWFEYMHDIYEDEKVYYEED